MRFVLDNSLIINDYQYFITYDKRIMYRKITLENGYDKFKELIVENNKISKQNS